jgi:hypothetical protein
MATSQSSGSKRINRRRFLIGAALLGSSAVLGGSVLSRSSSQSTADRVPEFGLAYDDEFDGENREWTIAGLNDVEFNGDRYPGAVFMESGMVVHRARVPPLPFTVTAYCSSLVYDDIYSVYANATLAIGGNVDPAGRGPRFYGLEWDVAHLGKIGIFDGVFDHYRATPRHLGRMKFETPGLAMQIPHYQRLVVNSGNDVDLYYSTDGVDYKNYAKGRDPGLNVEAVMLVSFGCETVWDWVRFS